LLRPTGNSHSRGELGSQSASALCLRQPSNLRIENDAIVIDHTDSPNPEELRAIKNKNLVSIFVHPNGIRTLDDLIESNQGTADPPSPGGVTVRIAAADV